MTDVLIVSLRLKSGQFESEMQIPFVETKAVELGEAIASWLKGTAAMLEIKPPAEGSG